MDTSADAPSGPTVTQIVAALPPTVDGVGDYATLLAEGMRARGLASRFVALAPGGAEAAGFPVARLGRRRGAELVGLLEEIGARRVVLHFSGYGYARRGLCFWLADGLCRWRGQGGGRRLVTVFHELYATGPIWRSSFWTALLQKAIARRLAGASDAMLTTSPASAARLRAWRPDCPAVVMPVFSNVGELEAPPPILARQPVAVVFGKAEGRRRAYAAMEAASGPVSAALRRLGIERLIDIGPGAPRARAAGLTVEALGPLPAAELSACLAEARGGIVDYPLHVFTKSGIAAAYLAHGLVCLNLSRAGRLSEDLAEGREFAHPETIAEARHGLDLQAIANAGHAWYRRHDRQTAATALADLLA